jgi:hypothetical protein
MRIGICKRILRLGKLKRCKAAVPLVETGIAPPEEEIGSRQMNLRIAYDSFGSHCSRCSMLIRRRWSTCFTPLSHSVSIKIPPTTAREVAFYMGRSKVHFS